ncbi:MAG: hypothetical protein BZ151_10355 [Desulfobacca sp. 4484_104]|nr:MAG: hypothetical protein BZ151_10355 [Desulfobacca sp. 4484_104]RLA86945.1 MAG: hypothetical protein DRG58_11370 [Deltaproteobacteria bacterium]
MDSSDCLAGSVTGFNYKLALILVQQGETREAAWVRHITNHPEAHRAYIKIFHYSAQLHPQPKVGLTGSKITKKHHLD